MKNNENRRSKSFEILAVLGEGYYGVVFKVKDQNGDEYAIKRINMTMETEQTDETRNRNPKFKSSKYRKVF